MAGAHSRVSATACVHEAVCRSAVAALSPAGGGGSGGCTAQLTRVQLSRSQAASGGCGGPTAVAQVRHGAALGALQEDKEGEDTGRELGIFGCHRQAGRRLWGHGCR